MTEEIKQPKEASAADPAEAAGQSEDESAFGVFRPAPEGASRERRRRRQPVKKRERNGRRRTKKQDRPDSLVKPDEPKEPDRRDRTPEPGESVEAPERPRRDKGHPRRDKGRRRRRKRQQKPQAKLPDTATEETQSPLRSFSGRVAIVEDTSVAVVEISAASAVSSTSLPASASPAEALAAAAKAVGRKGVVALASELDARSLGSERAEHPNAGRIQAALFASERFGRDAIAALAGRLVVTPEIDDDCRDTLNTLLNRRTRVVPIVACVPASSTGAIWVRIGRGCVDMTLVVGGEVHDVHSVRSHGADRYREMLDSGGDQAIIRQQWCSDTANAIARFPQAWTSPLTAEPEIVVSGPVLADPQIAGELVALLRTRTKLRTVEAPAALAGLVGVSPTLEEPACVHAVTAALAASSRSRLAVSAAVLGEQRRKVWRIAAAVAAVWVLVWAALGWMSQRAARSTEAELAAVEARIAQTEEALANVEVLSPRFDSEEARARYEALAAPGPDWGRYLRWAHATDHALVLDRSGQSTATIQIEAASVEEYLHQRITALEWLDCFARAVFDRQGFARSSSRGVHLSSPLPLTGTTGERISFEPEAAVWGVNPIEPIAGVEQPGTVDGAAPDAPAPLNRDDGRDCGRSPPHIRGISDQPEGES